MYFQTAVFYISLNNYCSIAVPLIVLVKLDPALQIYRINDFTVLKNGLRVHSNNIFAYGETGP